VFPYNDKSTDSAHRYLHSLRTCSPLPADRSYFRAAFKIARHCLAFIAMAALSPVIGAMCLSRDRPHLAGPQVLAVDRPSAAY
jgi:hypothetical protein